MSGDGSGESRVGGDEELPADAEAPHETYDRIAEHFSSTREYPWPEVREFLDDHAPEATRAGETSERDGPTRGLDMGCGNGRHSEAMAAFVDRVVALDASRGLLAEAGERAVEREFAADLVQGDAASLPLRDDCVAVAVYVATLHHLRPREARVASLSELARVLVPGGRALVSAWSVEHDRFDHEEGFDTTVDWTLPGGERVPRYYHIYDAVEFAADVEESALSVVDSFVSSGNCYAVVAP
ncbi:class I SAM-dependent methyltransferase [Halogeometricum sp. S1BR25-6]|uniref:Class I SAM-dependent methyltransferase n=1 Tax=Halogeometricum salsisoli TaxID=2950536 RepID=A0ABU2GCZ7_9EURY|nr:class I SAM-dependent methyltransferase [Halogeometricum sp. S1BR25-6]MDS0298341.1 class I SAM-dependent methyltransferase [Halogeometricum sp. S1BR25-6]